MKTWTRVSVAYCNNGAVNNNITGRELTLSTVNDLCAGAFQGHRRRFVVSSPGISLLLYPYPSFALTCCAISYYKYNCFANWSLTAVLLQYINRSLLRPLVFISIACCLSASLLLWICQCLSLINELVCLIMLYDNEGRWSCFDFLQFSQFLSGPSSSVWAMQQLTFTLASHSLVSWTSSFHGVALFSSFVEF